MCEITSSVTPPTQCVTIKTRATSMAQLTPSSMTKTNQHLPFTPHNLKNIRQKTGRRLRFLGNVIDRTLVCFSDTPDPSPLSLSQPTGSACAAPARDCILSSAEVGKHKCPTCSKELVSIGFCYFKPLATHTTQAKLNPTEQIYILITTSSHTQSGQRGST